MRCANLEPLQEDGDALRPAWTMMTFEEGNFGTILQQESQSFFGGATYAHNGVELGMWRVDITIVLTVLAAK
jgi:hypothetical protein